MHPIIRNAMCKNDAGLKTECTHSTNTNTNTNTSTNAHQHKHTLKRIHSRTHMYT